MLNYLMLGLIMILLFFFSIREKLRQQRYREKDWMALGGESQASPLSLALANLYSMAGGIYLSLALMCTFVELQLPERVYIAGFALEPLASFAIGLALCQPFCQRVLRALRRT